MPPPEVQAKAFLKEMQINYRGVACTTGDTDRDSYVTCTVRLKEPTKEGTDLLYVSCGAERTDSICSGGCKFK